MTLNFKQWEHLNEASIFSKIGEWFETTFGASYNKLKNLLSEYRDLETKFVDEWEEVQIELDKLELERDQTKSDPAEQKKIQRYISRNRDLLASMEKVHQKNIDYLMKKVKKAIGEEQKLRNFWELNKAKTDSDIAEEMYQKSKKLANRDISDSLYRKYRDAVMSARKKDSEFKEKYGELIKREPKSEILKKLPAKTGFTESSIDLYTSMSLSDFTKAVQKMDSKEVKSLVTSLTNERNDLYLKLEMEREELNKDIDAGDISREEAAKRIKAIRGMYTEKIRELRSKITVAKRNA